MERVGESAMGDGSVRWLWLLGVVFVLLAVVVGLVTYDRLVGTAVPAEMAGSADDRATARQAFVPAAELAGQWQEDAGLVAVSGHLTAVGVQLPGRVEWAFQFYSPATQRLMLVTVADGAAQVVRESLSPYVVPTFSAEEWRVDSDRALQTWWDRGGKTLVARRPDVDLAAQLRVPDGKVGQPVWTVVGSMPGTETAFTVVMNATDGTLVAE